MIYGLDERLVVRHSQSSPCTGACTVLVPEDREGSHPLTQVRVTGVGLAKGTYRVRIERVGYE